MKRIGSILILIISIISCEKDKDKPIIKDEIVIGDYQNMSTYFYDTTLIGGYNREKELDLDINKDNINDIRFISEIWGSPGLGLNPYSEIWCINNDIELLGYLKTDTLFENKSTEISIDSYNTVWIAKYSMRNCHRVDEADSVLAIFKNKFKIAPKEENDLLSVTDIFKSGSYILIEGSNHWPGQFERYDEDTIIFRQTIFNNNCNSFPLDEIKYIGFKLTVEGKEKLGWIKLSIVGNHEVSIFETSIQE